ncbi:NAD-dependent epimerase/dehydratase family protein [Cyanobium sp. NIES-981]|uniref:NAD-dependent epimerase/dehydratase family protein n=1 Tax=Cyanobium sp. NIES-981 TaxID=1851505 RepID=UPI0007DCFE15|nr:NAD-dependent epimerase/dehydratase family protein [Cyanobium sp. NIES-981]SBO41735.1 Short chain dehydrogenase [Cyanobium sp. NIES-981]
MSESSREATGRTVAITGASGALGQALLREWHRRGARLIALCAGDRPLELRDSGGAPIPLRQVQWCAGQESALRPLLQEVDVLVINHGINVHGARTPEAVSSSLEVNALSGWRLLELFAAVVAERDSEGPGAGAAGGGRPEVWLNTSEAEIQPAVSPLYEISKRLLGQLLSLRALDLGRELKLRRLVLGPFRSALNPVGLMSPAFVARQVLWQAELGLGLIIVTPNPLTYVLMPLTSAGRWLYYSLFSSASAQEPAGPC